MKAPPEVSGVATKEESKLDMLLESVRTKEMKQIVTPEEYLLGKLGEDLTEDEQAEMDERYQEWTEGGLIPDRINWFMSVEEGKGLIGIREYVALMAIRDSKREDLPRDKRDYSKDIARAYFSRLIRKEGERKEGRDPEGAEEAYKIVAASLSREEGPLGQSLHSEWEDLAVRLYGLEMDLTKIIRDLGTSTLAQIESTSERKMAIRKQIRDGGLEFKKMLKGRDQIVINEGLLADYRAGKTALPADVSPEKYARDLENTRRAAAGQLKREVDALSEGGGNLFDRWFSLEEQLSEQEDILQQLLAKDDRANLYQMYETKQGMADRIRHSMGDKEKFGNLLSLWDDMWELKEIQKNITFYNAYLSQLEE